MFGIISGIYANVAQWLNTAFVNLWLSIRIARSAVKLFVIAFVKGVNND